MRQQERHTEKAAFQSSTSIHLRRITIKSISGHAYPPPFPFTHLNFVGNPVDI
jgi:hypothetical protein